VLRQENQQRAVETTRKGLGLRMGSAEKKKIKEKKNKEVKRNLRELFCNRYAMQRERKLERQGGKSLKRKGLVSYCKDYIGRQKGAGD